MDMPCHIMKPTQNHNTQYTKLNIVIKNNIEPIIEINI
jgi:hypothetical protein